MGIRERLQNQVRRVVRGVQRAAYRGRLRRLRYSPQFPKSASDEECVLFFAPEAGAESHYSTLCLVAKTLQELGHKVYVAQCYQCFPRCPVVDLHSLPARPEPRIQTRLCQECAIHSLDELRRLQLPTLEIGAYLTPELNATVEQALAQAPANLLEFEYDGVNFGKLCCVDVSLALKRSEYETITGDDRLQWLGYIGASLRSYLAIDEILRQVPVKALVYFNDYSLMLATRLAARKHQIPTTTMSLAYHCNIDRRRMGLYSEVTPLHCEWLLRQWPKWRELALPPERVREIGDDVLHRLGGNGHTVYSPARGAADANVWDRLGLSKDRKLVVAFTSSKDEVGACRKMLEGSRTETPSRGAQPFDDQIEWLAGVADFARQRTDVQFVVRVHPREGAGPRTARASDHLRQLRAAFSEIPDNCRFVWPEDKISSYDLGEAADLVLVSWSSMGQEMARLGVPVLRSFSFYEAPCPRDDFVRFADTPSGYFSLLEKMLTEAVGMETLLRAWRWQNLMYLDTTLDFSDVRGRQTPARPEPFAMSQQAAALESVILGGREVVDINRERLLKQQSAEAFAAERAALLGQLRRITHFLFTGQDEMPRETISFRQIPGGEVLYPATCGTHRRRSPLITRLGKISTQLPAVFVKAA